MAIRAHLSGWVGVKPRAFAFVPAGAATHRMSIDNNNNKMATAALDRNIDWTHTEKLFE